MIESPHPDHAPRDGSDETFSPERRALIFELLAGLAVTALGCHSAPTEKPLSAREKLKQEARATAGELRQELLRADINDPEEIIHRMLIRGPETEDVQLLLEKLQSPTTEFPYPHFPEGVSTFDPKSSIEAHHGSTTLQLVQSLGMDHRFSLNGSEFTLADVVDGELSKGAVYQDLPARTSYTEFLAWLDANLREHRVTRETLGQFLADVVKPYTESMDISWFLELACRRHISLGKQFTGPLDLGNGVTVSIDDLVRSQINLVEQKFNPSKQNNQILIILPEHGVHSVEVLSTVMTLFKDDPTAREALQEYEGNFDHLYEIFLKDIDDVPHLPDWYRAFIAGHLIQYIFDPELHHPGKYSPDQLDIAEPRTEQDRQVRKAVDQVQEFARTYRAGETFPINDQTFEGFNGAAHMCRGMDLLVEKLNK